MLQIRPRISALAAHRRAAMVVEFALVSMALMMLVVGIMQVGFCLFAKSALDHAAATIARQLQTGASTASAALGQKNFVSVSVCGALHGLLDCSLISVTLFPVTDYLTATSTAPPFSAGVSKSLMLLTLTYASPLSGWPLQVGPNAASLLFTASVPFVNEY